MKRPLFETWDFSQKNRVFTCGDLHGEFVKLDMALEKVNFDRKRDVLVSLGDLVDRGPLSDHFEWYIKQPWFYRVLGNHDEQPTEYLLGYETEENVQLNGGQWFLDKGPDEKKRIADLLLDAPLAMEILTPGGKKIGFTHADLVCSWERLQELCRNPIPEDERWLVNMTVGCREVIYQIWNNPDQASWLFPVQVEGIDHVFHGHTPVDIPLTVANRTWIDTKAGYEGGNLTLIDIDQWLLQSEKNHSDQN